MRLKYSAPIILSVGILAVATPALRNITPGQCNTGPLQCCQSVATASDPIAAQILDVLGIGPLMSVNTLIGFNCSPIPVAGPSNICFAIPLCCEDNSHGGIVAIGCVPVDVDL